MPKLSKPLVKDIRTGEGVLEWLVIAGLAVVAILPHGLSWEQSGTFITIVAGLKGIRRGLVKIVALQKGVGIDDPIIPAPLSDFDPDKIAAEIQSVEQEVQKIQSTTGTPAEKVTAGLAPDQPHATTNPAEGAQ